MSPWRRLAARFAGGRPVGRPDPEALFADLTRAHGGQPYTDMDRYQDFRAVFLADARGKRVLNELLTWSRVFRPVFTPGDAYATHYHEGMRNIGLRVLAVINAEPAEQAGQAETEEPTEE